MQMQIFLFEGIRMIGMIHTSDFQSAGYNVTLRMHYTRPDERGKVIDSVIAAMGADA